MRLRRGREPLARGALIVPAVASMLMSRVAEAHHPVSGYALLADPVSFVELGFEAAAFDLGDASGDWVLISLRLEYAVLEDLAAGVRLPFARVHRSGHEDAYGLGDLGLSVRYGLYASESGEFDVAVGSEVELPTGDREDGLGNGHFEIAPFLVARWRILEHMAVLLAISDAIALVGSKAHGSETDDRRHGGHGGSLLSIHEDHEIGLVGEVAYLFTAGYVAAGSGGTLVLSDGPRLGSVEARSEVGLFVADGLRVAAAFALPVARSPYEWRARASATRLF